MEISKPIKENTYAIYGLGLSGISVRKFLKKRKVKKIYTWDDKNNSKKKRNLIFSTTHLIKLIILL